MRGFRRVLYRVVSQRSNKRACGSLGADYATANAVITPPVLRPQDHLCGELRPTSEERCMPRHVVTRPPLFQKRACEKDSVSKRIVSLAENGDGAATAYHHLPRVSCFRHYVFPSSCCLLYSAHCYGSTDYIEKNSQSDG